MQWFNNFHLVPLQPHQKIPQNWRRAHLTALASPSNSGKNSYWSTHKIKPMGALPFLGMCHWLLKAKLYQRGCGSRLGICPTQPKFTNTETAMLSTEWPTTAAWVNSCWSGHFLTFQRLLLETTLMAPMIEETLPKTAAKNWPNFSFKISPELQLWNLDQALCSKAEQKKSTLWPNFSFKVCTKLLSTRFSASTSAKETISTNFEWASSHARVTSIESSKQ